ncbi:MAG: hypothetical protein J7L45_03235 [Candidatus Aenigmarchaeota archaeon]|nr:hypothetical protein [Candidatus Aenigmarchaeota archaeon]
MKGKEFLLLGLIMLIPVIFVSGCVQGPGMQMIFGSMGQEKEAPPDVLKIQSVTVVPNPPITSNSNFEISFQVVNVGKAEQGDKAAKDVKAFIYDWGLCSPIDSNGNVIREKEIPGIDGQPVDIYPGGAELVTQDFKTPTNEELGNMEGTCPIRFRVEYGYDAHSTTTLTLISQDRLREAARAGESLSVSPTTTKSRGPIKIDLSVDSTQPVRSDMVIPVTVKVEDVGTGLYQQVDTNSLVLTFPSDFDVTCYPKEWIGSAVQSGDSKQVRNIKPITLIQGQTPAIRCDLKYKGPEITNMKTFTVRAYMDYVYKVYGDTSVTVKPTYQPLPFEGSSNEGQASTGTENEGGSESQGTEGGESP